MPQPFSGKWQFLRNRISYFLFVLKLEIPGSKFLFMECGRLAKWCIFCEIRCWWFYLETESDVSEVR